MKNRNLNIHAAAGYEELLRDESRSTGYADTISFPRNETEIREIVRAETAAGHPITVQGARTGLAAGAVPYGGHVLNLSRMTRILGMRQDGSAFYVTLQPGTVLSEFKKMLSTKKIPVTEFDAVSLQVYRDFCKAPAQQFPPDPTETSATLGGMVACNASGAKSYLYGPTRNWVEALRVVLPDGDVLSLRRGKTRAAGRTLTLQTESGKTLVLPLPAYRMPATKNASGYYAADNMDAVDLFIGADGTLGIVSEIEVKLCPEPPVTWGITCFFDTEDGAVSFVQALRKEADNLAALEYFDRGALSLLRHQKQNVPAFARLPMPETEGVCAVYTELHCRSEEEAYARLFAIGDLLSLCGGSPADTWVARSARDRDSLYFFRHATPESVNMTIDRRKKEWPHITKLGSDMSVPDEKLTEVIQMYETDLQAAGLEYVKFGHIGNNHLHVNILPRNDEEYACGKAIFARWAEKVTAMGGAVSAEHGIGKLKAPFLEIMYGKSGIAGMAALKRALDPKGLFSPGNLFRPAADLSGGTDR